MKKSSESSSDRDSPSADQVAVAQQFLIDYNRIQAVLEDAWSAIEQLGLVEPGVRDQSLSDVLLGGTTLEIIQDDTLSYYDQTIEQLQQELSKLRITGWNEDRAKKLNSLEHWHSRIINVLYQDLEFVEIVTKLRLLAEDLHFVKRKR